jgi:hypothetical protein
MNKYDLITGYGDTISCDDCNLLAKDWYTEGTHAICKACLNKRQEK